MQQVAFLSNLRDEQVVWGLQKDLSWILTTAENSADLGSCTLLLGGHGLQWGKGAVE